MISVAVVGANGYIGSALLAALKRSPGHVVTAVSRSNHVEMRQRSYDVVVNSAMPSGRYWAKNHPKEDFVETVQKTADLIYGWRFRKFVQVSTISARCQLDTVYGRHKAAAERLCSYGENLILRLGPVYGEDLRKGVLMDMLQGRNVYAAAESRYCFAPVTFVAAWAAANLSRSGVVEIGARNSIRLRDVADYLGAKIEFEGQVDHQEIEEPEDAFPDARQVLGFLDSIRKGSNRLRSA